MPTYATVTDPRSVVTPDAFEVSGELLGRPLATPRRRLAAMVIDLAVIGLITLLTQSFALILGVVAAVLFIRVSLQRTKVRGSVFGRAMRLSLGCLGVFIGVITAVVWTAVSFGPDADELAELGDVPGVRVDAPGAPGNQATLGDLAGFLGGGVGLVRADDAQEAREAMAILVRRGRAVGTPDTEIRATVLDLVPEDASWSDEAATLLDEAMAADAAEGPAVDAGGGDAPAGSGPAVAELSVPAALEAYAVLLRAGPDETDEARRAELRALLLQEVAGDTLAALGTEVAELGRIAENRREAVDRLRLALEEAEEGGGFFAWLRTVVDELGFGFGWASLYMTVVLSWWKGQTVGKKLMGIRVLRLDGEPITWWTAFERAGGYAAGFATGLLGFAQVWWDANRQAIHDRIVGTVVVVDGAEPVGNWERAL